MCVVRRRRAAREQPAQPHVKGPRPPYRNRMGRTVGRRHRPNRLQFRDILEPFQNRFTTFGDCRRRLTMDFLAPSKSWALGRGTMTLPRRQFLQFAGAAVAAPTFSRVPMAQGYPTRPITTIVPFPPGGPLDSVGRVLAGRMRASLGQPVIVENVSGAEGTMVPAELRAHNPMATQLTLVQ
jgi:hypothetical protein